MASVALVRERGSATSAPAPQAVLVVSDRRRIAEANEPACELIGLSRDQIVGRRLDALLVPEMRIRLGHVWSAFAEAGGHAGPFALATGAEVQISLTPNLMPDRHLLVLAPIAASSPQDPAEVVTARPETDKPAGGRPPSARELEVLTLLAGGATDPQIAKRLGLSPATVQTHVRNAKAKLGARTRAQAVALVLERGLIHV
jgi:DNA-binding CsgD family transcriptional regulator